MEHLTDLVRADTELELVVAAGLDDDGVASVQLRHVKIVGILLILHGDDPLQQHLFKFSTTH